MSIVIFDTPKMLYDSAATIVVRLANDAVAARGRFLLVLSGGATPLPLFEQLAQPAYRDTLPWKQTHVFWSDERMVAPDDEASNSGRARSTLLRHVPLPEEHVHAVRGDLEPEAAVRAYAKELAGFAAPGVGWPRFDLVILGLGTDGHTASLFPRATELIPADEAAMAVEARYDDRPASRVTLTPAAINSAREVIFLVTGRTKAHALRQALTPGVSSDEIPARMIRPANGSIRWFVDKDAASLLDDAPADSVHPQANIPKGDADD